MDAMIRRDERKKNLFSHRKQIIRQKKTPRLSSFQHFTEARAPVIIRRRSAAVYTSVSRAILICVNRQKKSSRAYSVVPSQDECTPKAFEH